VTNDTRGRLFELMVIFRCQNGVNLAFTDPLLKHASLTQCSLRERFSTKHLPKTMTEDGMYVPETSNFPSIDLIWKMGKIVCGVQVTATGGHDCVLNNFRKMCKAASWHKKFDEIYLVYVCPEEKVVELLLKKVTPTPPTVPREERKCTGSEDFWISVVVLSREKVSCLQHLQWPEGCTLQTVSA